MLCNPQLFLATLSSTCCSPILQTWRLRWREVKTFPSHCGCGCSFFGFQDSAALPERALWLIQPLAWALPWVGSLPTCIVSYSHGDFKPCVTLCHPYLQRVLLAASSRDLVLAGVTEVTLGILPAHLRHGLSTDHCPEDGILPCGRKRPAGSQKSGSGDYTWLGCTSDLCHTACSGYFNCPFQEGGQPWSIGLRTWKTTCCKNLDS